MSDIEQHSKPVISEDSNIELVKVEMEGGDDGINYGEKVDEMKMDAPTMVTTKTDKTTTATTNVGVVAVQGQAMDATGAIVPVIQYQQVQTTTYQETVTTHTFTRVDPGEYEGAEVDGKREGFGNCKWSDGSEYKGRWKDGVRWGEGTFTSSDGSEYKGEFVNDIKEGKGCMTDPNGSVIEGTWEKDRLNGQGTITRKGIPVGLITEQTPAFGGVGFVWIVYIISSCCTNSTKYICNTVDLVQTFKNIDMAIAARPICQLKIQNWHYEERTRTDSKGNTHTTRVRVNTHYAEENFRFSEWIDKSASPEALHYIDLFLLTRLFTFKYINLSPIATRNYINQKQVFLYHHIRDTHHAFEFTKEIPHHDTHCLAYNSEKGSKPWFTSCCIMGLMDLFFIGWIPRWMLDNNSVRVEYTMEKYILG